MFKNKKVIVTGGAGFIGSHIAERFVKEGAEVHIIDNLTAGKEEKVPAGARLHNVDIRKGKDLEPIFEDASYVFHLAALPRVQFSIDHPVETFEVNVGGMLHVLEASRKAKVERVVFSASSSAYGNQEKMPLVETMMPDPLSPYALHKLEGEFMCRMYSNVYNLSTVSLRYFNVYGPGIDPAGSYPLAIAYFLKSASEGKPLPLTGDGLQTRDFTHVRDVVEANVLAATGTKVGKGEIINIGSGKNWKIIDVAKMISDKIEHIPPRIEPKNTLADNSRAKELLGWTPKVSFEDGIAELKKIWNVV